MPRRTTVNMSKISTMSVLLLAVALVVCALATPTMSSAASWGAVGTEHTLDSPNFSYSSVLPPLTTVMSSCSVSSLTTEVRSAGVLAITHATFGGCTVTGTTVRHCTSTLVGTQFPWTATAVATNNIQIHGVHIDVTFEDVPGIPGSCAFPVKSTLTGTVTGGSWTGNGANQHEILFNGATGLVSTYTFGSSPVTLAGTLRDTQQTLTVLP